MAKPIDVVSFASYATKHTTDYNEELVVFHRLCRERGDILAIKQPKLDRKGEVLEDKLENISDISSDKLQQYNNEVFKQTTYRDTSIFDATQRYENTIENAKDKYYRDKGKYEREIDEINNKLQNAKDKYDKDVREAKDKLESVTRHFTTLVTNSLTSINNKYETKKNSIERKENSITKEQEHLAMNATSAQLSKERKIQASYKILEKHRLLCFNHRQNATDIINKMGKKSAASMGVYPSTAPMPVLPDFPEGMQIFKKPLKKKKKVVESESESESDTSDSSIVSIYVAQCPCGSHCPLLPEKEGSNYMLYRCQLADAAPSRKLIEEAERDNNNKIKQQDQQQRDAAEIFETTRRLKQEADHKRQDEMDERQRNGLPRHLDEGKPINWGKEESSTSLEEQIDDTNLEQELKEAKERQEANLKKPETLYSNCLPLPDKPMTKPKREVKKAGVIHQLGPAVQLYPKPPIEVD